MKLLKLPVWGSNLESLYTLRGAGINDGQTMDKPWTNDGQLMDKRLES